ncbi:MAG: hypothetical protein ABFE02_16500, partial [Sulfuricella sp.]
AIANGYKDGLQLDRIDNNGNYCPVNCRFVTPQLNNWNRRNSVLLTVDGEAACITEWSRRTGCSIQWVLHKYGEEAARSKVRSCLGV